MRRFLNPSAPGLCGVSIAIFSDLLRIARYSGSMVGLVLYLRVNWINIYYSYLLNPSGSPPPSILLGNLWTTNAHHFCFSAQSPPKEMNEKWLTYRELLLEKAGGHLRLREELEQASIIWSQKAITIGENDRSVLIIFDPDCCCGCLFQTQHPKFLIRID